MRWHYTEAGGDTAKRVAAFADQMVYGVQQEGITLGTVRLRGLGRARIAKLVANGLGALKDVMTAPRDLLQKLLTKPIADRLRRRATYSAQLN